MSTATAETGTRVSKRATKLRLPGLSWRIPSVVTITGIRIATLVAYYLLVMTTAVAGIPMLGVFLHEQSPLKVNAEPTAAATIALWLMPYVFAVVMVIVAEVAVMSWLWRSGTRRIATMRARAAGTEDLATTSVVGHASPSLGKAKKRKQEVQKTS